MFWKPNTVFSFCFQGKLCLKMALYFIWPFGKSVEKVMLYNSYDRNSICIDIHYSMKITPLPVVAFVFSGQWCSKEIHCEAFEVRGHSWRDAQRLQQGPREGHGLCSTFGIVTHQYWDPRTSSTSQENLKSLGENVDISSREVKGFIVFLHPVLLGSPVSRQYIYLAPAGLSCRGCGPLPGLRALLAVCFHNTCGKDECSHTAHHPAHGTRGHPGAQTGKGTERKTMVICVKIPQSSQKRLASSLPDSLRDPSPTLLLPST